MIRQPTRREYLLASPSPLAINLMLFIERAEQRSWRIGEPPPRPYYWALPPMRGAAEPELEFTAGGTAQPMTLTDAGVQQLALQAGLQSPHPSSH